MPSYYRGIDDDCHIWRIDVENDIRPSKRQRTAATEFFEKYGIDTNEISSSTNRDASFHSCFSMEENMDNSSSLESSWDMMIGENDDDEDSGESVESILKSYIRVNNELEIVHEGLDKILARIGLKNNSTVSRQHHRVEMLNFGGHWMITDLLANLMSVHDRDDISRMDIMDDEDDDYFYDSVKDGDEILIAVVARACQILRELLATNRSKTHQESVSSKNIGDKDSVIRYQIYSAGGLDVVISALKRYPTNFEIQLAGCQVLSRLASSDLSNANHGENKDSNLRGSNRRRNTSATMTPLISNLYQSTDRLNIIVRLVGSSMRNSLQNRSSSNTQMWQLYYVVSDIVRSIVRQLPVLSPCRSEIIRTIRNHFIINNGTTAMDECNDNEDDCSGDSYRSGNDSRYHNGNNNKSSNMPQHDNGIGKHMYEHLMTIFDEEEDHHNADEAASMND